MSDSADSDDSVPSLASYPPAFVSLITTFIKRAEEAETRAHKALVILKAKDEEVVQLQQRMEVLEKIACRLEEVMVPPLELPKSPLSTDELSSTHPRDLSNSSNHRPIGNSYEQNNKIRQERDTPHIKEPHNCYEKCQHLIDGLERSNCQLREALAAEGHQRVKDHEQYVAALAKVTQTFKEVQQKYDNHSCSTRVRNCTEDNRNPGEAHSISAATGGGDMVRNKNNFVKNDMAKLVKESNPVESSSSELECTLQNRKNSDVKRNSKHRSMIGEKCTNNINSKRSLSSLHALKSQSNLKFKRVHISSQCFLNALKKQNKKLKNKYYYVCEKFTETLNLCEKLQKELVSVSNKNKNRAKPKVDCCVQSTQTDDISLYKNRPDKLESSKSTNILNGRLEAAAKVMAKQCKQIQDLQKQLGESLAQVDSLKKRLTRAETATAGKDTLVETTKKQLQDSEKRNLALTQEVQQFKNCCSRLKQELTLKTEEATKIKNEKESCEFHFQEMKISLESKLLSLTTALQEKENYNTQMTTELQNKLCKLREQFLGQVSEARDRLVSADFKIQELYLGIETFLKLLFALNTPELSPSSQAQAVQVASDILQITPTEVQTILHSSRGDMRVVRWIRECNRMVREKVFAKDLGNLLIDAVLEAKIASCL